MLFNSLTFVAFFAIVLALWYAIEPWRPRKAMLLVASYVFYAAWNPPFILILWLSTLVDWFVARWLYRAQRPSRRRLILLISLVVNLGLLGYFKYGGFVVENFGLAARALGLDFHPARPDIILPIGISFYTFETISYTIDVYLGRCKPFRSFLDYGLFLTFFPHLVAGPILRPDEIVPQFERPHRATSQAMGFGLFLVTLGLFEKVVLADSIFAPTADAVFGTHGPLGALDAWAGILAFTGQIFCDFAGYSTCAIGAAICFGISLPDNFRFPYAAIGFSDFWRRWHISLSRWLRDYLYVPLGGNRNGATRTQINLMLTMLIGGLWHGASWNFVMWGGIHGVYLLGERLVRRFVPSGRWVDTAGARTGLMALTFLLTCVTWVFFRAKELSGATSMLAAAFGAGGGPAQVPTQELIAVGVAIAGVVGVHWSMRDRSLEDWATNVSNNMLIGLWTVMAFSIALTQGGGDAFIYFQF